MTKEMLHMRPIQRLMERLPAGADAALVVSGHNRRYLTGFPSSAGVVLATRETALFLTDFRYIEAARRAVTGMECVEYSSLKETLVDLARRFSLHCILTEDEGMTVAEQRRFSAMLPDVEWKSGVLDGLLGELRLVKSPQELEKIKQAQALTEYGFDHILGFIRPGRTEREVALELEFLIRRQGAEGVAFDFIVVSGANSSLPHGVPGDKVIEKGDFVTMDFGARVDGWHSDMTRTVAVGSCSPEQRKVYDTVLRAQKAALSVLRAGLRCVDGDAAAREVIAGAGYGEYFGHATGHGVGVEIHEQPRLSPRSGEEVLSAGSVVTVEPGIYLPGRFGVRIEDMASITEGGCENLTKSPKELLIL